LNHWLSPNDQFHIVGELVEVSLNWTARGAVPAVTFEVKLATGWTGARVNEKTDPLPVPQYTMLPSGLIARE
jgi:hypothetical protein